jgi:hypothetical protein
MGGKLGLLDDALGIAARAVEGSEVPAVAREGFKIGVHPGADASTKDLMGYLNNRNPDLPMDAESLLGRRQDTGHTVDAFHGAPRDLHEFDNRYSEPQGYWGGHHYFTSSPVDASNNYATREGADLFNRLGEHKENILDGYHPDDVKQWHEEKYGDASGIDPTDPKLVDEWSSDLAADALGLTNHGAVYPTALRMKNPVRIDSPNQTFWDHVIEQNDDGDFIGGETGPGADLLRHTKDALSEYGVHDTDASDVLQQLYEHAVDNGGIDAGTYNDTIRKARIYPYDPDGNMVSPGHVMSDVFRRMGHDGIDMPTDVFAGGLARAGMAGTGGDTRHYILFDPKNVRSRFGAFDPFKADSKRLSDARGGLVERPHKGGGGSLVDEALRLIAGAGERAVAKGAPNEVFPHLADRYPEVGPPEWKIDKKKGEGFWAKKLTPEALAVQKARKAVQGDIDAGNYAPYFDVGARADVDPSAYPKSGDTITEAMPKRPDTQATWRAKAYNPDGLQRLREGYEEGLKQKDVSANWYFMKQLEDKFVAEYGPEEGKRLFKERFAKGMATTTGGADPSDNLMMAYYGNYMQNKGLPIPETHQMPFPIGGRYVGGNMDMFERNIGSELTPDNPKRMNFQNNFLGHKDPTIDEQMSKGFDPKLQMPEWYGPYEEAINSLAAEYGVDPRYFQEVGWAGLKAKSPEGYTGKPMIQHVNEAIERTSRITGVPPEEVVGRGLVRAEMPLYGVAAPLAGAAALTAGDDEDPAAEGVRIAKAGGGAFREAVEALLGRAEREGLSGLTAPGSGYRGIRGKPDTVDLPRIGKVEAKPIPGIMDTASSYMAKRGLPGAHEISLFPELDIEKARRIAKAYDRMKHAPDDPAVKRAYEAMSDETMDQFRALQDAGIDFTAIRGDDPYRKSPAIGYADIAERGHLSFFPTDAGFGSGIDFDPSKNPLLKRIGKVGDLDNATVNDAFRIVHDAYGHYGPGNPHFRGAGEERAFKLHSQMYSPDAVPAMASETRGQNSWLNYGPHGEANRTALSEDTKFADQKTGLMPAWTYKKDWADGGVVRDALRIAKAGGGPAVMLQDANGNSYDQNGNIIGATGGTGTAVTPAQQQAPAVPVAPTAQAAAPANYETDVKPVIDSMTAPMDWIEPSEKPSWTGSQQAEAPTLLDAMKTATRIAASGQPAEETDTRGEANWERGREKFINSLYGLNDRGEGSPAAADQAAVNNTIASFVTSPVEMLHDIPYEAGRTGDYGTAAVEGGLNALLTAPGIAGLAAVGRKGLDVVRNAPKVAAGLAGAAGLVAGSDQAEAGPERWFSKLLKVAEDIPMQKMSSEQALAMLRKGASPEELRWTGTEDFLKNRPTVLKGELLDHIQNNRVKLNEITLGGSHGYTSPIDVPLDVIPEQIKSKYRSELNTLMQEKAPASVEAKRLKGQDEWDGDAYNSAYETAMDRGKKIDELSMKMRKEYIDSIGGLTKPTKFHAYSTQGGKGYQESLYQYGRPNEFKDYLAKLKADGKKFVYDKLISKGEVDSSAAQTAEDFANSTKPELLAHVLGRDDEFKIAHEKNMDWNRDAYASHHWQDPDVAFHTRSQSLSYDPPGSNRPYKVHNVDETQSDPGQAGRKTGFYDPRDMANYKKAMDQYKSDLVVSRNKFKKIGEDLEKEYTAQNGPAPRTWSEAEKWLNGLQDFKLSNSQFLDASRENNDVIQRGVDLIVNPPSRADKIPAMPFIGNTEAWTDRAIKHELDKALDNGSDYFSWTPGEVHADRYNLSKYISVVDYDPKNKALLARDHNGDTVLQQWNLEPEKLDSYIGKELAEKLLNTPVRPRLPGSNDPSHILSGLDLKVGGEGMKGYYDNVYLKRVQKTLEKATGMKIPIEEITVQTADGPRKQLGIKLNDDIRSKAKFSDFKKGGRVTSGTTHGNDIVSRALAITGGD